MLTKFRSEPRFTTTQWPVTREARWTGRYRLRGDALSRAWGAFLGRVPWELFVTLTFDPKRVFPASERRASREAFRWCNDTAHTFRSALVWAYAVERGGGGGAWHAHTVIAGAQDADWEVARGMWVGRNGGAVIKPIYDEGAAMYTTKAAALNGEIVLSDTIGQFRNELNASVVVSLHAGASEIG
jgi:hypothetical protein